MMVSSNTLREPILVINAGSSGIRFSVFETAADRSLTANLHEEVEASGTSPRLKIADAQGRTIADAAVAGDDHHAAIAAIHNWFAGHVGGEAKFDGNKNLMVARHTQRLVRSPG
jgi:acetate kinase